MPSLSLLFCQLVLSSQIEGSIIAAKDQFYYPRIPVGAMSLLQIFQSLGLMMITGMSHDYSIRGSWSHVPLFDNLCRYD